MTTALSLRGLCKRFRAGLRGCAVTVDALRDIDLDVHLGEIVGLVGRSGAGKTTLLFCAAGVIRPDDGNVSWFGVDHAFGIPPAGIGYVPDRTNYYPFLTAREALEYYTTVRELGAHDRGPRVAEALRRVGLEAVAARRISQLAPGAKRRIAIAQILLGAPRLVLIDDPVEEIDPRSRACVHAVLRDLADAGTGVLLATRDAASLDGLASRFVNLDGGRLRELAPRLGRMPTRLDTPLVGRVAEAANR
jgi:ABC-type multidrug transport system ATPase subunit